MATQTIYAAESATTNVNFTDDEVTHAIVLTDATNVVATMQDASTVDFGDPQAGSILAATSGTFIKKLVYDTGTFRAFSA